jgi:cupin 2 domain-containing protein
METDNIYKCIPDDLSEEIFELLIQGENIKIERIISKGHKSPGTGWYDQEQNEWILVLKGDASISFENETVIDLKQGDYLNILAHRKHRVINTSSTTETIWLAIHY